MILMKSLHRETREMAGESQAKRRTSRISADVFLKKLDADIWFCSKISILAYCPLPCLFFEVMRVRWCRNFLC